jgi:uncharacterized repeat protein (TIGR01451 family)
MTRTRLLVSISLLSAFALITAPFALRLVYPFAGAAHADGMTSLAVQVAPLQSQVEPGQPLTYRVTVTNTGTETATQVVLDDYIHADTEFVGPAPSQCGIVTFSNGSQGVRCFIPSIAPGITVTRDLPYRSTLAANVCGNGILARNSAGVSAQNAPGVTSAVTFAAVVCAQSSSSSSSSIAQSSVSSIPPSSSSIAQSSVSSIPPSSSSVAQSSSAATNAVLSIAKTVAESQVLPGGLLHYHLSVHNEGPATANQVYVDDYIHAGLQVEYPLPAQCGLVTFSNGGEGVRCFLNAIAPATTASRDLTFRLVFSYPCGNGSLARNDAGTYGQNAPGVTSAIVNVPVACPVISSSSSSVASSIPSSSSSSSSSVIIIPSSSSSSIQSSSSLSSTAGSTSLHIIKTVSESSTQPGQLLHYHITVSNVGSQSAQQAYFDDYIHPNMFVNAFPAQCGLVTFQNGGEGVRCFLGTIAPGTSVTRDLVFSTGFNYACGNGSLARNDAGAWAANAPGVTSSIAITPVNCVTTSSSSSSVSSVPSSSSSSSSTVSSSSSSTGMCLLTIEQLRQKIANGEVYFTRNNYSDGFLFWNFTNCDIPLTVYSARLVGSTTNQQQFGLLRVTVPAHSQNVDLYVNVPSNCGYVLALWFGSALPNQLDWNRDGLSTYTVGTPCQASSSSSSSMSSTRSSSSISSSSSSSSSVSSTSSTSSRTNLTIQNTVAETQVSPYGAIHYTVTVRNAGSVTAQQVVVEDAINTNAFNYLAGQSSNNCTLISATVVRCTLDTLTPGQQQSLQLTFQAPSFCGPVAYTSAAARATNADQVNAMSPSTFVVCNGSSSSYSSYSSSSSSSSRSSVSNHGLSVTKEASVSEVFPGGTIEYTVRVKNDTSGTMNNVRLTDSFDDNDLTVIDDGNADDTNNGDLQWNIGTLSSGQTRNFTYRLRVRNSVRAGSSVRNDAEARADGYSDSDSVNVFVIGTLPQTGFTAMVGGGGQFLRPITQTASASESMPWTAFFSLAASGLSAGAYAAKKFILR